MCNLREPERTLTLLAAGTGLRISECLGLQWHDVNFADGMTHVRRTWTQLIPIIFQQLNFAEWTQFCDHSVTSADVRLASALNIERNLL